MSFGTLVLALVLLWNATALASENKSELDALVEQAQELVYSNPTKLDSVLQVLEDRTLAKGDSSYFYTIRSIQGIRAGMQNDFGPSLKYFYDIWNRSKRLNDTLNQKFALLNMSGVCQMSGRHRDAKKKLETALSLTRKDEASDRAELLLALGMAEVELNQFDSAVTNFKMAIQIFDELENEHYVLSTMNELGYALEAQHRYKDALDIYKRMEVLYQFTDDATGEIVVNQRKGHTLMHLGRNKEAVEALELSLAMSDSLEYEPLKDSTLLRLVKANAALGNIDGAEKYTKQLMAYIKQKEQKKNEELIAFVEAKYNLEEKARVNDSLAEELQTARADLARTALYLRFALAGIVLLFLSIVVIFRRLSPARSQ